MFTFPAARPELAAGIPPYPCRLPQFDIVDFLLAQGPVMVSSLQPGPAFPRRHRRLLLPQQIIRSIEIECGAVDIVQALIYAEGGNILTYGITVRKWTARRTRRS